MQQKSTATLNITPKLKDNCKTITWARGSVGYPLASVKCYVLRAVTTKPSPSHITAENGLLLLTAQTLAVEGTLQIR